MSTVEARVDDLDTRLRHTTDLSTSAARDARAADLAHRHNVDLLNALRETQAEHSHILAEHSGRLAAIDGRLDRIDGKLGQLTLGMHTIESLLHRVVEEH